MRSFVLYTIAVCAFGILSLSCAGERIHPQILQGDTLDIRHSSHLQIVECEEYTLVTLRNPWDTLKVLHTYVLMPCNREYSADSLPTGTVVRVPLQRSVVFTAVHNGLVDELGALDAVIGVCDSRYINLPAVQQRLQQGRMIDLGSAANPDVERIIDLQSDALLLSPFENSGGYGRIEHLDVPIIECADYMETSPLGRAEWMRFYGRLYGCGAKADSLFAVVEKKYMEWRCQAQNCESRPTVFADLPMGTSAWYVSGGGSTIGRMYADAGAHYLFADKKNSGSIPLSYETIYEKAQHAEFWLIRYHDSMNHTYRSLADENSFYTRFDAYRNRRIFGCNTAYSRFYDEVPFHPERLLAELVCIFHPELKSDIFTQYQYYAPLEVPEMK